MGILSGIGSVVRSYLTAPDNKSYAPGRLMGFAVFAVGQGLVVRSAAVVLASKPDVDKLITMLGGVSTFEAAICGTAAALIMATAPADPGGAWWRRDASPPPPPTSSDH